MCEFCPDDGSRCGVCGRAGPDLMSVVADAMGCSKDAAKEMVLSDLYKMGPSPAEESQEAPQEIYSSLERAIRVRIAGGNVEEDLGSVISEANSAAQSISGPTLGELAQKALAVQSIYALSTVVTEWAVVGQRLKELLPTLEEYALNRHPVNVLYAGKAQVLAFGRAFFDCGAMHYARTECEILAAG